MTASAKSLRALKVIMTISVCLLLMSCSIKPVKSWEKGVLAEDLMQFGGPNPMIKKFDEHIFTSKEGTKGGNGVSGGGCGCN